MTMAILVGVIAGFVASVPPGPLAVAIIKQALEGRYRDGSHIALAAALMDVVFTMFAAFASSAIISNLRNLVAVSDLVLLLLKFVAVGVLIFLGVRYFRATSREVVDTAQKEKVQEEKARRLGFSGPFLLGILIAITNLASPTFLPFLISISGYLHAEGWIADGAWANVFFALGFGVGAGAWFMLLLKALSAFRHRLPPRFIAYIYHFAGGTFFLFAAILLYKIATATKWGSLL